MLKRNIAILIAGGLLSAQAGLAVAAGGPFPDGADIYQYWNTLPAQIKYLEQRAASNPNPTGVKGSPFPVANVGGQSARLPSVNQYFAERAARDPNPTGVPGGAFGDECLATNPGG
jgi:hypothetical protein